MGTAPELEAAVANLALLVSIDPLIVYVLQMLREFLLEDVDDSQRSHGFLLLDLLGVVEYALLCLQFRVEVAEVQLPQLVLGLAVLVIVTVLCFQFFKLFEFFKLLESVDELLVEVLLALYGQVVFLGSLS